MGNSIAQQYPISSKIKLENQCYVVPDSKKEGWSEIRRSILVKDGDLVDFKNKEITTLYENFRHGAKKYPNNHCLGTRVIDDNGKAGKFVWQSYKEVEKRVTYFASGLLNSENPKLKRGSHIGIYAKNRPEWTIAELACYAQAMIPISLYDTLGPDACAYIINQAEISVVIAEKENINKLLKAAKQCKCLKLIIQMEKDGDKELINKAKQQGITIFSFSEVEDKGALNKEEYHPANTDDLATIMYTSGTTGKPKGVMLTHKNIVSVMSAAQIMGVSIKPDDVHLSYLPLAHIFERVVQSVVLGMGAAIGFYQGIIPKLTEDIMELKPTVFASVPRLFNRIFDKTFAKIEKEGGIKKFLFESGLNSKKSNLASGGEPISGFWDRLVFSTLKQKLGGRVRLMLTGSAPISKEVQQFLLVGFCCPVLQGYGLTESSAPATLTLPWDFTTGHCGPPLPCCEVVLQDVPEMNYTSDGDIQQGEVCLRGNSIFIGYYKNEKKTKEEVDEDGWFHTGDIGQWNKNGTLSIIDRKKNIFKLAQGEYVAAEYVESVYRKNKFVEQIFIYGDSLKHALVAIVVPDREVLVSWGKENRSDLKDFEALCNDESVQKMLFTQLTKTAKENELKGFEIAKQIHFETELFSVENGLLTPTFKPKRPQLKEKYKDVIDKLYQQLAVDEKKRSEQREKQKNEKEKNKTETPKPTKTDDNDNNNDKGDEQNDKGDDKGDEQNDKGDDKGDEQNDNNNNEKNDNTNEN